MPTTIQGKTVPVKLWADPTAVESAALDQLRNIAALPWVVHHVAVMPDVHLGKGATVGSVIAMRGAVSPAAVGVDIGCGMAAVRTNLTANRLPDDLKRLRSAIEAAIPVGFAHHASPIVDEIGGAIAREATALMARFRSLTLEVQRLAGKAHCQIGTLGGGNHFIELCLDTEGRVWLMLHSGSRNIGKELAEVHIARAKTLAHNVHLPDRDLAAFLAGTPEMDAYRRDLYWAQEYAALNRTVMLRRYQHVLRKDFPDVTFEAPISCHHNYVAEEVHFGETLFVTRKGAIRAGHDDLGIIPGSMGTKSYIVRGLGNPESFESASHGAGRRMSRGEAKRRFTAADLAAQTAGVECRKDAGVVDETPGAYKPIDEVMASQADLVTVVAELKQVLCVKG
ncbi:RtcB family protein [Candidatus Uhrbacteria bacterium]|nr:RtcB family protein [Candidatus Uhrbacteria bacterium]